MKKRPKLQPNPYSWRTHGIDFAALLMVALLGLALLLPRDGWTHDRSGQPLANNCHILIIEHKHTGDRLRVFFKTHLESRRECKRLAELHTPNFEPDQIARKLVSYRWNASGK